MDAEKFIRKTVRMCISERCNECELYNKDFRVCKLEKLFSLSGLKRVKEVIEAVENWTDDYSSSPYYREPRPSICTKSEDGKEADV